MNERQAARQVWGMDAEVALLVAADAGGQCSLSQLEEAIGDRRAASEAAQDLRDKRLADQETSMAGELTLNSLGKRTAAEVRKSQERGLARFDAVQRGLLEWSDGTEHAGSVDEFVGTADAEAYGVPFTVDEVREHAEYLADHDCIKVIRVSGPELLLPSIKPRGRNALHADGMIREYLEGTGVNVHDESNTVNVSGGVVGAFQQGGRGNTMGDVSVTGQDQRKVLELVGKALHGLGDADEDAELRAQLAEIQAEVETGEAEKPRLLQQAGRAMLLAAATDGGRAVIQGIGELVSFLGT